ncbi:MAG: acyl-CoA carboxylase subunit beta [Gammaproteobacteria bacterium]|nr:acyl-CoA carboxylase subunit beta [Gammaproteobacteria bacterium]NNM13830.1 acyl-CoA carboxylase subunit beta [Gammaproteobacteria bacterium]
MANFTSRVNPNSAEFKQNRQDMLALIDDMHQITARAAAKSEKSRPRFERRGQLLPRERLSRLLDPGMPFLELQNMSGYLMDTTVEAESIPGSSMLVGIGFINGTRCMVYADDSGINAGAFYPGGTEKFQRMIKICLDKKLPFVHLVESAGADLLKYEVEVWLEAGAMFAGIARLSAAGLPSIVVLHGRSVAGGAYMTGLGDYVVGVKDNGRAYLAGPALLKAATGEEAGEEELGGAETHAKVSGLVEYLAEDDAHGLAIARDIVERLDWNRHCPELPAKDYIEPVYSADEFAGIVPIDYRKPYDAREVVARIVDGSDFLEFKPDYGVSMLCLHAKVYGHPIGILANNGPIDPNGATKAAQFIQLCDQSDIPLVFLQNITGYMVGKEYERAGMIKHGSKMVQAVTNARVNRITFQIGASFGAGNYGMCGYGFDPDFLFTWPNAKLGVMGGESAAKTMIQVQRDIMARKGIDVDEDALAKKQQQIIDLFDSQSSAFYTSGRMFDDGVIDPRDTRKILGFILQTCWEANKREVFPNAFGVARM